MTVINVTLGKEISGMNWFVAEALGRWGRQILVVVDKLSQSSDPKARALREDLRAVAREMFHAAEKVGGK